MNKLEKERRAWKLNFKWQYQKTIIKTVERMTDLPAELCCQHIAHLAERLSQGQLTVQYGVLLMYDDTLCVCAHCWNVLEGEPIDLSPMASRGHPIRYLTPQDGEEYQFYFEQTGQLSEKSKEDLDADVDILLAAMVANSQT